MSRQGARQPGQTLVFFALALPTLVLLMAFGIDAANLYANYRRAQSAADLAALAGARLLPAGALAEARAVQNATANGYPSGVDATAPYDGDQDAIEVEILSSVRTFFLPVIGVSSLEVTVRAVAESTGGSAFVPAVFAGRVNCTSESEKVIDWSGSSTRVIGAVHSNSGILLSGSSNTISGATTYNCANRFFSTGGGNALSPPAAQTGQQPWPVSYTAADFPCTFSVNGTFDLNSDGAWWVGGKSSSQLLLPGVYCATGTDGTIKLGTSGTSGTVTFVAARGVELSGSNFNLVAHTNRVLAFARGTGDSVLKLSGSGGSWTGILYAPNGQAEISGSSNLTIAGAVIADRVKLNGSSMTIDATALQSTAERRLQLVR